MLSLVFKGKSTSIAIPAATDIAGVIYDAARSAFALEESNLKILCKGKQLDPSATIGSLTVKLEGAKCMVMASGKREVSEVVSAKSDPTIRSFASEDNLAKRHLDQAGNAGTRAAEELSVWAQPQHKEYRFCRFEACTWQSFGTRPSSKTPHAFEARSLLLKLAQDPAVVEIMVRRKWTVGLLAELDPIDDRHAEKMEGEGKRLLGYNTNAGAQIHIRLRTEDLAGFLPYSSLIDTLLHELSHNDVGPHNEHFWHLFTQLKVDYLRSIMSTSERGVLFSGKSPVQLAEATEEVRDIRTAALHALQRDRQMPVSALQTELLDGYMAATAAGASKAGPRGAQTAGGADAQSTPANDAERRALLAARASERLLAGAAGVAHKVKVVGAGEAAAADGDGDGGASGSATSRSGAGVDPDPPLTEGECQHRTEAVAEPEDITEAPK
jgi:hypothetical protein